MKIFCVGRNYADHAQELGNDVPDAPIIFIKPKSALLQPNTPFYYPQFSNELHYEIEVVLRISKNGKYISAENAHEYYNAITVGIDFTARDLQNELKKKGLPWEKAKAWDQSAVVGKWLPVNPDMLRNPIQFSLKKNGEWVQKGITSDMIFSFDAILSDISDYFSINIGDLIYTGTPAGVGECLPGDILEGFIGNQQLFQLEIK